MKGLTWTICILSLLSACAGVSKESLNAVERGEKAMVISKCLASTPPVGIIIKDYSPVGCMTGWVITEGRHEGVVNVLGSLSQGISIDIIEPGEYSLSSIRAHNHDYWNDYTDVYKTEGLEDIANFEAEGGDVIYIGDIDFNLRNSAIIAKAISLKNDTVAAERALTKRYPRLAPRFRARLLKLTPYVAQIKASNNSIETNFTNK